MKIIEKNCPSCGASVKFNENEQKGICEYCKKEFLIEKKYDDDYLLTIKKSHRSTVFAIILAFSIIVFFLVWGIVSLARDFEKAHTFDYDNSKFQDFVTNIQDIPDADYYTIDASSRVAIKKYLESNVDFKLKDGLNRKKVYLLNKNDGDGNILICIYEGIYSDGENNYTIYTPVLYKNVRFGVGDSVTGFLGKADVTGDKFYFNLEHSEFTIGYNDMNDLYSNVIEPLESNYKIS